MAKTLAEVIEDIKANLSVSKKGKPVKSFSRQDFDRLMKAYVNSPDHVVQTVSKKGDDLITTDVKPVEGFRSFLRRILIDFGVDKQEADEIATKEIKNVDGLYEFLADALYTYVDAGKKFDFLTTIDFMGSVSLHEVDETVKTHKNLQTGKTFEVNRKKHKVLKTKSRCPEWLRTNI